MDAISAPTDVELAELTVTVPSGQLADFYAQFGRWLADKGPATIHPPVPPWPGNLFRPPRPLRRPYRANPDA